MAVVGGVFPRVLMRRLVQMLLCHEFRFDAYASFSSMFRNTYMTELSVTITLCRFRIANLFSRRLVRRNLYPCRFMCYRSSCDHRAWCSRIVESPVVRPSLKSRSEIQTKTSLCWGSLEDSSTLEAFEICTMLWREQCRLLEASCEVREHGIILFGLSGTSHLPRCYEST